MYVNLLLVKFVCIYTRLQICRLDEYFINKMLYYTNTQSKLLHIFCNYMINFSYFTSSLAPVKWLQKKKSKLRKETLSREMASKSKHILMTYRRLCRNALSMILNARYRFRNSTDLSVCVSFVVEFFSC